VRWMIRDTFRQSLHTKLVWVMLAISAVCTLFAASVRVSGDMAGTRTDFEVPAFIPKAEADRLGEQKVKTDGVRVVSGEISMGFGLVSLPVGRHRDDSVRHIQLWLAAALADTAGVLLALLWTAGFLPTFLEPQSATVLLAKPAPRWAILVGKYLGVVLFVALQAVVFVLGTWLALGLSTGVWNGAYWLAVPLLVINFAVFYAVSTFLAVCTRSTVAAAFGTLLFWIVCWAANYGYLRLTAAPLSGMSPISVFFLDAAYWVLPKPLDLSGIFFDAMRADGFSMKLPELQAVQDRGLFRPELSVLASLMFGAVAVALAGYELEQTDY
jgi:hypothetical protein